MRTRPIVLAALSVLTTLARASTALAHGGGDDGPLLSLDSLGLAIMTSVGLGALCFLVMVWDPQTRRK